MQPLIFSQRYPSYHPKAKQPTYFVEAILTQQGINWHDPNYLELLITLNPNLSHAVLHRFWENLSSATAIPPKHHTIRGSFRIKHGQQITPRVWSGTPYRTKQITFAPPIEIVYTIGIAYSPKRGWYMKQAQATTIITTIARNDGLAFADFAAWFNKPFAGQIICWNNEIQY